VAARDTKIMRGTDEQDVYTGFNDQEFFAAEQLAPVGPREKGAEERPPTKVSFSGKRYISTLHAQGSLEPAGLQRFKSESSVLNSASSVVRDNVQPHRKSSGETMIQMGIQIDSQMPQNVKSFIQTKKRGGLVGLGYEIEQEDISKFRKCKTMCSREVMAVCVPVFMCAVTHLSISIVYFGYFNTFGITIFISMAVISVFLVLSFLVRIFMAVVYVKVPPQPGNSDEPRHNMFQLQVVKYMSKVYNSVLEVDGEYYLLKMYAAEAVECGLQLYNIVTIYSCSMRIYWTHAFCWFLAIESMYNTYKAFHMRDQVSRDQQLVVDVLTDSICLFFPLFYLHFVLDIPVEEEAMLQLTCLPTLFLMSKANDVWENLVKIEMKRIDESNIKVDTVRKLTRKRTSSDGSFSIRNSFSSAASSLCGGGTDRVENSDDYEGSGTLQVPSRTGRRTSIMAQPDAKAVIHTQKQHFKRFRHYFVVLNIVFIACFLSLSLVHLLRFPREKECNELITEKIWSSCDVRTPFCQDLFLPKCDCAVLEVSNYTEVSFPSNMMSEMKSLIKIGVYNGRLEQLPHDIGVASQLAVLDIVRNKLRTLPPSLEKSSQLLAVRFIQNNLTALPSYFRVFKKLYVLQVDSNFIETFHDNIVDLTALRELYARNNSLNSLPPHLEKLKKLSILDVRENNLTAFPTMENDWNRLLRVYAEGNPLCRSELRSANVPWSSGAVCEPQCSRNCLDVQRNNVWCDDGDYSRKRYLPTHAKAIMGGGCNTPSCNFDNGMCPN
jgi:Leucine-rich repeat (LRR) protein